MTKIRCTYQGYMTGMVCQHSKDGYCDQDEVEMSEYGAGMACSKEDTMPEEDVE